MTLMMETKRLCAMLDCPYCGEDSVIWYGKKCKKQRFLCKTCGCTFVSTTNTVMVNSHFPIQVWKEVAADTLLGRAIDHSAKCLGLYQQSLADAIGISKQVMNKITKGSKAINVSEHVQIAPVMGITTDDLLMIAEEPVSTDSFSSMGSVVDEDTLEKVKLICSAIDEIHMLMLYA